MTRQRAPSHTLGSTNGEPYMFFAESERTMAAKPRFLLYTCQFVCVQPNRSGLCTDFISTIRERCRASARAGMHKRKASGVDSLFSFLPPQPLFYPLLHSRSFTVARDCSKFEDWFALLVGSPLKPNRSGDDGMRGQTWQSWQRSLQSRLLAKTQMAGPRFSGIFR